MIFAIIMSVWHFVALLIPLIAAAAFSLACSAIKQSVSVAGLVLVSLLLACLVSATASVSHARTRLSLPLSTTVPRPPEQLQRL